MKQKKKKVVPLTRPGNRLLISGIVLLVVIIGFVLLPYLKAATPYVVADAEFGAMAGTATLVTDGTAANSAAVRFGQPAAPGRTLKLMPLGDSITASTGLAQSWRYLLWKRTVIQDGGKLDFVGTQDDKTSASVAPPADFLDTQHEGHSGWCIDVCNGTSALNNITNWMTTYQPDIVMVHFGTNDIYQNTTGAVTTTRMDTLLARIYAVKPDTHVILSKIINNTKLTAAQQQNQQYYWNQIPVLASKYQSQGRKVTTVDLSTLLVASDYGDGIHPNQSGMTKMSNAYYPVLTQVYRSMQ
jgi:hypothetical protein